MDIETNSAHRRASISLFRTAGWLQGVFDNCLRPYDLSSQQLRALSILAGEPRGEASVGRVRDGMMDPNSNISRLLNKLMEKGLIEKSRDDEDQRVVTIRLSEAGQRAHAEATRALSAEADIWGRLSTKEAETLASLLDRLRG